MCFVESSRSHDGCVDGDDCDQDDCVDDGSMPPVAVAE